jgi:hypothetical protein
MSEHNLLASVAVFRELYDSDRDIYDVIAEFIRLALVLEKKWTFNVTELSQLLKKHFDFQIPDAVVKTALKKRLKRDGLVAIEGTGTYTDVASPDQDEAALITDLEKKRNEHAKVVSQLIEYIRSKVKGAINEKEMVADFYAYLLDTSVSSKYSTYISSFIIENQEAPGFRESLNAVKEGLVLYSGLQYSSDLNSIGVWNTDLTIYLDTEHLFSSLGYNGLLYKAMFDDFYRLASEINTSSRSKVGKGRITLKYFEENKKEIEGFFYVAELIIEGKANLDPSKTAMITILNGSRSPSDVITKKAKFFTELQRLAINVERRTDFYSDSRLNIEDQRTLDLLRAQCSESGHKFDEDGCRHYLKLFTRINVLRQGANNVGFERVGFILMSANSVAHFVANSPYVREDRKSIPFATDIEFIIDRLWFKLKKGLGKNHGIPGAIDVVTKARLVLSAQVRRAVAEKYSTLLEEFKQGKLSKDQAAALNAELRERASKAEDITPDKVSDNLLFIDETDIETHLREKAKLQQLAREGAAAIEELRRRDQIELRRKKARLKVSIRRSFCMASFSFWGVILGLYATCLYLIVSIRTAGDTPLSLFGAISTFVLGTIPLVKVKWFFRWLRRRLRQSYLKKTKAIT